MLAKNSNVMVFLDKSSSTWRRFEVALQFLQRSELYAAASAMFRIYVRRWYGRELNRGPNSMSEFDM